MAPPCCALLWIKAEFSTRLALPLLFLLLADQPYTEAVALDAVSFQLPAPPTLTGSLASNNVLLDAEQIHNGQIGTPHSYAAYGDNMYAVTDRGHVVNVAPCMPAVVANLRTRGCQTAKDCGHLVSIRLSPENLLLVLDAYRGLFEVHPYTGVVRLLYDAKTLVNGRPSVYLNDFAFLNDGTLVFSEPSPTFDYHNEFWIRFEGRPDGRLLTYNSTSGQAKEVLAGISYPTGLEVTDDGKALLVSEAGRARILRINLAKDKFFQRSYFSENLPGMPEHIRKSGRGTYWVGLSYPRYRGEVSITDQYSSKPSSRNFLAVRRTKEQLQLMYTKRGLAIEMDGSGRIVRSFHDPTGLKIAEVLELTEYSAVLYVGTRAQRSTVRIVGSPNSLTVDSLVQVLRGRCQVSEDRIQEAKASLEQQLKAQKGTTNDQGGSGMQASVAQNMGPGDYYAPSPRRVNISHGLSELHRTLINAPQRHVQTYEQPSQGNGNFPNFAPPYKQEGHNFAPPYSQQGPNNAPPYQRDPNIAPPYQQQGPNIPPTHQQPVQPLQPNGNFAPQQRNVAFDDPFLPVNGPQQMNMPLQLQKADRLPSGQTTQQTGGSPNQPHVVHSLHKGELVSHVILGKKAELALAGNLLTSQQSDGAQVSPSQNENPASPAPVNAQTVSPTPRYPPEAAPQQKASEDISALGGFLGFIDSNARAGTSIGSDNQQPKLSPHAPISTPDQKAPGHLEPLHSIISGPPHQTDQHVQSGASFPGLELFTGSQDLAKQNHISANGPQPTGSSSSSQLSSNSFVSDAQKQHGPDMMDTPNVVQNMQMFHPTSRPDNTAPSQNQAGAKLGSTFQQKASLLKQGLHQLHRIFQDSPPVDQSQAQLASQQKESRTNTQEVASFDPVVAGSVRRTTNGDGDAATRATNKQVGVSNSAATSQQGGLIPHPHNSVTNENNAHLTKQPLTPFSRAAAIHHNQPANNIFDKRFPAQARVGDRQGGVVTDTNSPVQTSHAQFPNNINSGIHTNDHQSSRDINSGIPTSHSQPSLSVQPTSSHNPRQNTKPQIQELHPQSISSASNSAATEQAQQPAPNGNLTPTGYIQVYQSPGQYLLIPLTQTSLIQALRGLSASQVKGAQLVSSHTGVSQQSAAANGQVASSQLPVESSAPSVQQENNFTQGQKMANRPIHESLPGKSQPENQNRQPVLQQDSDIQNPQQQTIQRMQQEQPQRLVQYERTPPQPTYTHQPFQQSMGTSPRQHSEHNVVPAAVGGANFRQDQHGRSAPSNSEWVEFSTLSANTNSTPTPKWFTHNSDQENGQSTQQFTQHTQQITQPVQQGTQNSQQFSQPTQQFEQSAHQFSQSAQQINQQTQQYVQSNQHLSQPARQLTQSTQQFTQPTQQFTQPAQRFTQPAQQFTQPAQRFTQPVQQFTQAAKRFTQPAQRFTQPAQRFTQETKRMPTQNGQQYTPHFNTRPAPTYIQQPIQKYDKYPTRQSSQKMNNYSVSLITKFPTQHRIQQFTQPNTQFNQQEPRQNGPQSTQQNNQEITQNERQSTQQNNQEIAQNERQSTQRNNQEITQQWPKQATNGTFTQQNTQQATVWQAPHFTHQSQQDSVQEFSQQPVQANSQYSTEQPAQSFPQQLIRQPHQQIRPSDQGSQQSFTRKEDHDSSHYSTQAHNQLSSTHFNDSSKQNLTQPPIKIFSQSQTQQLPRSFSQSIGQFTEHPTYDSSQVPPVRQTSQHFTNNSSPHNLGQPAQDSAQQFSSNSPHVSRPPVQQTSQQFTSHSSPPNLQQPVQTSSNHSTGQLTPRDPEQPVQQSNHQTSLETATNSRQPAEDVHHQFPQRTTGVFNQPSTQQSLQYSNDLSSQQPTQQSLQQFNDESPQYFTQQTIQQTQSTQQNNDQSTQHITQPSQSPQRYNDESSQYVTQQSFQKLSTSSSPSPQSFIPKLTQPSHQSDNPPTQSSNQQQPHPSQLQPQQLVQTKQQLQPSVKQFNDRSTQFTQQPTQQSSQQPTQQSSQQPMQPTHNYNTDTTQHFTNQPSRLFTQPSSQYIPQGTAYYLTPQQPTQQPTQQSSQQPMQSAQHFNTDTTQHFTNHPSQLFTRPSSQHPSQGTENHSTPQQPTQQSSQQPTQQSSQQPMQPTYNYNTDTTQHFTNQPSRLFTQPSSQYIPQGTAYYLTPQQPTQQPTQQSSQQPMQSAQHFNTDTTQHFTNHPSQLFTRPSSQHPSQGTENHSTPQQPTQQSSQQPTQQSSQQPMQPTYNYNTDTTQHFTNQPSQLFTQPSSQHIPQGTEYHSTPQQPTQQLSQQPIQPTYNFNTDTTQHFTNQPSRLFTQPSSQRSSQRTENQSTQFTQQPTQQSSQQLTLQPTEQTAQAKVNVNTDTAQYLTLTSQQSSRHTTQGTEEIVELPNELFTPQPAKNVGLQP